MHNSDGPCVCVCVCGGGGFEQQFRTYYFIFFALLLLKVTALIDSDGSQGFDVVAAVLSQKSLNLLNKAA